MTESYEYDKDGWPVACPACEEDAVFSPRYANQGHPDSGPPELSAYYAAALACAACGEVFRLPYPSIRERRR